MTCSTTRPLPKPEGKAQRGKVSSARATPHRPIAWWAVDKESALDADACWEQILHHLCNPLRISHYHPRLGFLWQLLGSLKILFLECCFHLRGSKPQRTGRGNTAWPGSAITEDVMELHLQSSHSSAWCCGIWAVSPTLICFKKCSFLPNFFVVSGRGSTANGTTHQDRHFATCFRLEFRQGRCFSGIWYMLNQGEPVFFLQLDWGHL